MFGPFYIVVLLLHVLDDGIAELRCSDSRRAFHLRREVFRHMFCSDCFRHALEYQISGLRPAEMT